MSGIEGSLISTGGIGSAILAGIYLLIRVVTERLDKIDSKMDKNNELLQAIINERKIENLVEDMFDKHERHALRGVKASG